MHSKNTTKFAFTSNTIEKKLTSDKLTHFSGLSVLFDFIRSLNLDKRLDQTFPTVKQNATKTADAQSLLLVLTANLAGVCRLHNFEKFSEDPLVSHLLNLKTHIDENVLKTRLSRMGKSGANKLQELLLSYTGDWTNKCGLSRITIDCDSTEKTVYGHQEGAAKGYNPKNKGKKTYHPLLCFCKEMKIILNSWFRAGNTYTSNGTVEFMKQTRAHLPKRIKKIFFRADSGFFDGKLFDFFEDQGDEYLVKAKLYGTIKMLLQQQQWQELNKKEAVCEFEYKGQGWSKSRTLRAIRILTEIEVVEIFGEAYPVPHYEYFVYCSNLKGMNAKQLHHKYGERAETENWIENAKNQLYAGTTITDSFDVNDILWQLAVLAYNISVFMRYESDHNVWRQEPATFRNWFILVAGKVVRTSGKTILKVSHYDMNSEKWWWLADKVPKTA